MPGAIVLGLLIADLTAADTAVAPGKSEPRVARIAEPGALAFDYRGGLLVADRKLNRVAAAPAGKHWQSVRRQPSRL
jgi:hypothetical protein